ncbi:glycoside hydrolase family 92 protein [Fulvivirga sp. M361]|uniref:GH92 family glycosyl hydrolase n=1 Tax=Fulvivirga sp. M361 TaxID=2594266 RepID=UPI00117A360F|nr:GH92 family glycosyl hydrolase [Fulvivirga sp. M361]TRX53364.1 glycoside hydrolase family 92 protein [Fulvivirga sp. M361]
MKSPKVVISILVVIAFLLDSCQQPTSNEIANSTTDDNLVQYVNPLMGTDSDFDLSNGNTYPAIATPWGMNFWTPMTSKMGDGWTYKYDENKIRGIKQTHQPSPWINDYAAFSLMGIRGSLKFQEDERSSWFSHKAEIAKPHYYSVYLADYDLKVEVSPTERAAQFKFTFPESDSSFILLDGFFRGSMVKVIPKERKIIGYCRNNSGGVPENFHNYFVAQFDKDFEQIHTWEDDWKLKQNTLESEGEHVGAIVGFKTRRGEQVHVKVASSFISPEQAQLNLDREIGNDTFEQTRSKALKAWQTELSRIKVEDDNIDNVRTFYSCLYRLLLFPRKFYEIDKAGSIVHYSPYNGEVLPGYMFTDNGFWDTFRAVFPFFTLMYPQLNAQIMEGLVNTYKESGWLPEWASPGHRQSMIGSNSAINIADSYMKGIRGYDIETLYEAMLKNATTSEGRPVSSKGQVINSVGREGIEYYNKLGYVPYNVSINENAARTLEYAFADFAISRVATELGKPEDATIFRQRSENYKHLFDKESGWMRGKNEDGTFQSPFNPLKWGDAFTEGNSLHYTWSVFHDIQGLIGLMGGEDAFAQKLDAVFEMPPDFDDSYYGFTIHEIREMQIVNMGNYAHGNQPIQHMIYLYNYAAQPWKAQQKIRQVMDVLYTPQPDGYCGDEDNGQTSAWYVFSALGFYPVTPATTQYVIGSPLFKKVTLTMEDGKILFIKANANNTKNVFIESVKFNGKAQDHIWVDHHDLQKGGVLEFTMTDSPNKNWGTNKSSIPFSMSNHKDK